MCDEIKKSAGAATPCADKHETYSHYKRILDQCQEGTQEYIVLSHMMREGSITALEAARRYYITRLSARIYDLSRNRGIKIGREKMLSNGGYYFRYYLEEVR